MEIVALILSCITLLINAITVFLLVLAYKEQKRPTDVRLVDKREDHTNEDVISKNKVREWLLNQLDLHRKELDLSPGGSHKDYFTGKKDAFESALVVFRVDDGYEFYK